MPIYEVEANGKTYEVDAPDEKGLMAAVQSLGGGQQQQAPSIPADMAKSFGTGLAEGTAGLAGAPRDVGSLMVPAAQGIAAVGNKVRGWLGMEPVQPDLEAVQKGVNMMTPLGGSKEIMDAAKGAGLPTHEPETTAGKYARTAGQFVPGAVLGPVEGGLAAGMAGNALKYGVIPGVASEAAGQAVQGTKYEKYEPYARVAAALAGSQVGDLGRKLVTPNPVSPERQKFIDALTKEGVDLTAGQKTGSKSLQFLESAAGQVAGGSKKAAEIQANQGEQFTKAALSRMGVNAERATPEAVEGGVSRLGQQFEDLSARNTLKMDVPFGQAIGKVINDYERQMVPTQQRPIISNYMNDLVDIAASGNPVIAGEKYQSLRSEMERQAKAMANSSPETADALKGLRKALDDAMTRSISPEDATAWSEARRQWKNWKTLEQATTGAGENAAQGLISPSALRNATVAKQGRSNYAQGKGDFAELSRAGEAIMKPLPDSGTAGRAQAFSTLGLGTGGLGAMIGGAGGAGGGYMVGAAVEPVVKALMAKGIMSGPAQKYLANQLLTKGSPADKRVIEALMAARSASLPARD